MRFSAEWFDDAPYAAPEEAATACILNILHGNVDLTEHRTSDDPEVFAGLVMPAAGLAMGLARDWWRIFGSRTGFVRLDRYRMGHALPDVRLRFDGEVFESWAEKSVSTNPDVQFFAAPVEITDRATAQANLSDFIVDTVGRLSRAGLQDTGPQIEWVRVQESLAQPDETMFCEAAGALRLDPYAIDQASANLIEQSIGLFEGEGLLEFLSGIGRARGEEIIDWIDSVERRPAYDSRLPHLRALAQAVAAEDHQHPGERGYSLGYRRAQAARRRLGLGQTDRIPSMRDLGAKLGSRTFQLAPSVNGLRALRSDRRSMEHVHLRTLGDHDEARSGHLFTLARAVGDAVCFPQPGRYPVNDLRDAYRQSVGRAFAAEFLAPIEEVRSMSDDGLDAMTIASEFGVSPQIIEHQLDNEDRIRGAISRSL